MADETIIATFRTSLSECEALVILIRQLSYIEDGELDLSDAYMSEGTRDLIHVLSDVTIKKLGALSHGMDVLDDCLTVNANASSV